MLALLSVAILFSPSLVQCYKAVNVENRSMGDLSDAAHQEKGTLRVAWGGDVRQSKDGITKAFNDRYPNIHIFIDDNLSKYHDSRIERKYAESNGTDHGVDLAVIQTTSNFPKWKREGRLMPYKVISWDDIYPEFVDPEGAYTGLFAFSLGQQVYNPNVTNSSSLPSSYSDFLLPQWKDKIILAYPNDDDAVLYLFKVIFDKYGFDFLNSLVAQNVKWVRGTATPSILIANLNPNNNIDEAIRVQNSRSISFSSSSSFTKGISVHEFEDEWISWPQTGAIFSTTQMPETAKLFLNFLMDDEWQAVVSKAEQFATRRKFDVANIFNQNYLNPLGYAEFMEDRRQVETLRFQIESVIGTAQGKNPVEVW